MEIYRNDPMAKVTLLGMYESINKIQISKGDMKTTFLVGSGPPPDDVMLSEDDYWIDESTGDVHGPLGVLPDKFEYGTIEVPYKYVHFCGKFQVWWNYTVDGEKFEETQQYDVVQTLFDSASLVEFDSDFKSLSESQVRRLERTVRAVIQEITGQKFELTHESLRARSYNGTTLVPLKRLVALEGSGKVGGIYVDVESDGWVLRARSHYADGNKWFTNPIYENEFTPAFGHDRYSVKGYYGYSTVPEDITLAAMLLAQDYGCRESAWRDKYIANMKNADWRVEYDSKAFVGTGNAKVDLILRKYITNKMVVI